MLLFIVFTFYYFQINNILIDFSQVISRSGIIFFSKDNTDKC